MKKAILVAHGQGGQGTFSIPKVKTITPANTLLTFIKAKEYINSSKAYPEYSSTSFGVFGPLSDADCTDLFGKVPGGSGIVSTGLTRDGDLAGPIVYALRGAQNISRDDITKFINDNAITSLVLLACRG